MGNRSASDYSYPWRIFIAVSIGALSLVLLYLLVYLSRVLLIIFAGVLMAVFLGGLARQVRQHTPLPRAGAVTLVVTLFIGLIGGLVMLAGPQISSQVAQLAERLPVAVEQIRASRQYEWTRQVLENVPNIQDVIPTPGDVLGQITNVFSRTFGVLANLFIVFIVGIYGAVNPAGYVESVVYMVPHERRNRAREVLHALGRALRWWLIGRFTMMVIVGVLTAVGLWIAGVPSAMALGLIAALLAFVPYIGPILSAVPAILVAFMVSMTKVIYVLIVYGAVQTLESYLITPLVQERAVSILPAALISAQVIMGVLAGAVGVLLATPLAVSIIVLIQMLYVEDVLGDSVKVLGEH